MWYSGVLLQSIFQNYASMGAVKLQHHIIPFFLEWYVDGEEMIT